MVTWASKFTFGKYKDTASLIQVFITDKEYLAWCFANRMEKQYAELQFIQSKATASEWRTILAMMENVKKVDGEP